MHVVMIGRIEIRIFFATRNDGGGRFNIFHNSIDAGSKFLLIPNVVRHRKHLHFAMLTARRRGGLLRIAGLLTLGFVIRLVFFSPSPPTRSPQSQQIKEQNFIERATRAEKSLDVQRFPFLQARFGRDERDDIFTGLIYGGMMDYWRRLQLP